MMRNRIVAVSYLNTIPFIYGIEHAGIDLYADLLLSPPRGCASLLRDGGAEIALIPVAAVPSIPDIRIVTPFCIGASRSVRTVVLAADSPLDRLDTIYLDSHSLTSVRLVRILASKLWGIRPEWKELKDFSALNAPQPRTGYLIIGDKVFDHEDEFIYSYDLAAEWREATGLPFAFAVWVARKGTPYEVTDALEEALTFGVERIYEAVQQSDYRDRPYAYDYLTRNIDFLFDNEERKALQKFWTSGVKVTPLVEPG